MLSTNYSFGIERDEEVLASNDLDHRKWTNPLEIRYLSGCFHEPLHLSVMLKRLPNAPSMKFICVYGHGKETEVCGDVVELSDDGINSSCPSDLTGRSSRRDDHAQSKLIVPDCQVCSRPTSAERLAGRIRTVKGARSRARQLGSFRVPLHLSTPLKLDRRRVHEREPDSQGMRVQRCLENVLTIVIQVRNGVKMGEGDGTVSLLSMGAMCVEGWKRPWWNPARINVTTVEVRRLMHSEVQCN